MKTPVAATPSRPNPDPGCPRCGSPIPEDAPAGLCPRCLLDGATTASEGGTAGGQRLARPPRLEEVAAAFPDLEILGFLGAGGMGCVYHVRERATGEDAALKLLPREFASDPAFVERFEREARTLARLRHPHIVGVRRYGQSGAFCHLLMEHVDGANLRQALRAGRFTPTQALALIPPLCDALQYAHAQGVLHRDIKPENILLDAEGRVKIADFGIAKILGETGPGAPDAFPLTHTGARLGTPHYMAPEQVERPEAVDHRADLYSLGVVFYELLTGELPLGRFQAPSAKAALDARVDDIVLRALAKERELRQQSANQIKAEIERLAESPAIEPSRPGSKRRPGRGWRWAVGAIALAWLGAWLAGALYSGSLALSFADALRTLPLLIVAAVVLGLGARALRPGPLRARGGAVFVGLLLTAVAATWYPRGSLPRWVRPDRSRETVEALVRLGIHLRESGTQGPDGFLRPPENPLNIPMALRFDPVTGRPFFLAVAETHAPAESIIATAPPPYPWSRPVLQADGSWHLTPRNPGGAGEGAFAPLADGSVGEISTAPHDDWAVGTRSLVQRNPGAADDGTFALLADGSVRRIAQARYDDWIQRQEATMASRRQFWRVTPDVLRLVGPPLDARTAEAAVMGGATLVHTTNGVLRPLQADLATILFPLRHDRYDEVTTNLFALLQTLALLPEFPDLDVLFTAHASLERGLARPDFHENTQARHGGLLAMLAAFAARTGNTNTLFWAQANGRSLWTGQDDLLLCKRRLDGESDQDWEEVRMRVAEVLALRPGDPAPMTVLRRFKAYGPVPTTNRVDCAWPRRR